jgi:hypothetical protein
MKKKYLVIACLVLLWNVSFAQKYNPESELKKTREAIEKYQKNMLKEDNPAFVAELMKAKEIIDPLVLNNKVTPEQLIEGHLLQGKTYVLIGQNDYFARKYNDAGHTAADAFMAAIKHPQTPVDKQKLAAEGLVEACVVINKRAKGQFEDQKYREAYFSFNKILSVKRFLLNNKYNDLPLLETPAKYSDQQYLAALSAYHAQMPKEALILLDKLYNKNYTPRENKGNVFAMLANLYINIDLDRTEQFIREGKIRFSDDRNLQLAEVNYQMALNQLDPVKIAEAIKKDPTNKTLYYLMASQYSKRYMKKTEQPEAEREENFKNGVKYFQDALKIDPNYPEANYGVGALYYNKMVVYQNLFLKETAFSSKAESLQRSSVEWADKTIPHFDLYYNLISPSSTSETLDPNTISLLADVTGALSRIYFVKAKAIGGSDGNELLKKGNEYEALKNEWLQKQPQKEEKEEK